MGPLAPLVFDADVDLDSGEDMERPEGTVWLDDRGGESKLPYP
jgi:hypothetical protein